MKKLFIGLFLLSSFSYALASDTLEEALKRSLEESYGLQCQVTNKTNLDCQDDEGNSIKAGFHLVGKGVIEISLRPKLLKGMGIGKYHQLGIQSEMHLGMRVAEDIRSYFSSMGKCSLYNESLIKTPWSLGINNYNSKCVDSEKSVVKLKAILTSTNPFTARDSYFYISTIRIKVK